MLPTYEDLRETFFQPVALLLGTRSYKGAPGLTTSNKKLLGE